MRGLPWDDPYRIRTWQELVNWVNEIGFLPLFANDITGFSAEEHVSANYWWTGDKEQDPWKWREIIVASHKVAYGKFLVVRLDLSARRGYRTLQTTGATAMTLIPATRTVLQLIVRRSSWIIISVKMARVICSGSRMRFSQQS